MASLVMTDKENELIGFPIARDGIGVLVNQSNSLVNLSERELLAIFTGEVRNWEKVGGPEGPITVIDRDEGRGSTTLFIHHFKIKHADIRAQKVIGDNNEAITAVATEAQAVTLMSIVAAENSISGGTKIKLLSLNGVPANSRNIITGSYPLARPLTLVTKGLPDGVAKDFIEFALSSQTIDIIREIGFVPYQE
jgi:phosphate transport system substrate-binding protein